MELNDITSVLDGLNLEHNLRSHAVGAKIVEFIADRLRMVLPKLNEIGYADLELLKLVATCIENLVKKSHKLDKKKILLEIYRELFPLLGQVELGTIANNLETLLNNKMIKKVSVIKKLRKYFLKKK